VDRFARLYRRAFIGRTSLKKEAGIEIDPK